VRAGLVFVVADDPHGWSSAQSEQDSRFIGPMCDLPIIEPSNPQEAKEFTALGFEISKKYEIPIMLHTTTKINHAIGTVSLGKLPKEIKTSGEFVKDYDRYYNITPGIQAQHTRVLEKLKAIAKDYNNFNKVVGNKKAKIGIITSGVCYEYLLELGFDKYAAIAKLNLIYPFPEKFVANFIKDLKTVIVVEQLEPFIEGYVKQVAKDVNPKLKIHGKDILPRVDELELDVIYSALAKFFNLKPRKFDKEDEAIKKMKIVTRKPALCPGCPHRSTFYAVKSVAGEDHPMPGDIGCYILGIYEPFKVQDFDISMGASAGFAHGFAKVGTKRPIFFVGDSTFFHAALPGIVNMQWNDKYKSEAPIIVVLDNSYTAMTGHQPNPSTGANALGEPRQKILIEDVVRAFGIKNVEVANSFSQQDLQEKLKKLMASPELGVLISRGECRLMARRKMRAQGKDFIKFEIDNSKCTKCGLCIDKFACPAIQRSEDGKRYWIDTSLCWGCSVCSQICPAKAIKPVTKV
jgi:indolepyruvate ferredoxin oxidoreductase alpha subunit